MNIQTIKLLINTLSALSMLAGVVGMLVCATFLLSSKMEDLVAAGLPFIGGAILFGSGLITLGVYNKEAK